MSQVVQGSQRSIHAAFQASKEDVAVSMSNNIYVHDIAMDYRTSGVFYFGQATVWIKAEGGANIEGALVSGDWSGSVSESPIGTTGSGGTIMFESTSKKMVVHSPLRSIVWSRPVTAIRRG